MQKISSKRVGTFWINKNAPAYQESFKNINVRNRASVITECNGNTIINISIVI
jgi:hypothetical protein